MRSHTMVFAAGLLSLGFLSSASFAEHRTHHPDQASGATGATAATPDDGAQQHQSGCPMMQQSGGGNGGMKCGKMGRGGMGGKHGGKKHGRHAGHHGQSPAVVINIYPGGMGMMHGGGMSMMGHGGMGQMGGMMQGGGMGMMGHGGMGQMGGMMHGGGMMMAPGRTGTPDQPITVDAARAHIKAMTMRMGGGVEVGDVKELDQDLIDATLTDSSGAAAGRIIVNRHTGAMMRVQ